MTDKEKIKKYLVNKLSEVLHLHTENAIVCRKVYQEAITFVDSMDEEPVSEDLEKEIQDYYNSRREYGGRYNAVIPVYKHQLIDIARHFAAWQKEQMMAKAFDFTQEHNIACILASECLRNHGWFSRERVFNNLFRHLACVDKLFEGKFCGKTKVIVIKED